MEHEGISDDQVHQDQIINCISCLSRYQVEHEGISDDQVHQDQITQGYLESEDSQVGLS